MSYSEARSAFDRLRNDLEPNARTEYEDAVNSVVERYNTAVMENRFTAGGAAKIFTYAILRSVGVDCSLCGGMAKDGDIVFPNGTMLSIKSSFTGVADVRLINKQGKGAREWRTATFFVISGVGIVYGDPNTVNPIYVNDTGDAMQLHKKGIFDVMRDDDNVIQINLKRKPPKSAAEKSLRASEEVVKRTMREINSEILTKYFPQN